MTKIVTLTKKPAVWEEVSDMLEGFVAAITDESTGLAEELSSVVLMYRTKDGDVTFECTTNATAESVGMMAAAVHMACLYEMAPYEDGDETVH
ncbi:MAG: hypothetical protein ACPG3V_09175 [Porticoccaceae bacterium]|jgi:hypothetical protein